MLKKIFFGKFFGPPRIENPYNPAWSRDHPGLKSHTIPGGTKKIPKIFFFGDFYLFFFEIDWNHYTVVGLTQI